MTGDLRTPLTGRATAFATVLGTVLATVLALLLTAGPAAAHGQLAESDPVDGSATTTALEEVTMWFTELPGKDATFVVTAPDGSQVQGAWAPGSSKRLEEPVQELNRVDGVWTPVYYETGYAAVVPLTHLPATGTYTVAYESRASDGEEVVGTTTFTYRGEPTQPAPGSTVSAGGAADPEAVFPTVTATPSTTDPGAPRPLEQPQPGAAQSQTRSTSSSSTPLVVAGLVAALVAVNVVALVVRRSRASAAPSGRGAAVAPRRSSTPVRGRRPSAGASSRRR